MTTGVAMSNGEDNGSRCVRECSVITVVKIMYGKDRVAYSIFPVGNCRS
jgi:hypothetical protein